MKLFLPWVARPAGPVRDRAAAKLSADPAGALSAFQCSCAEIHMVTKYFFTIYKEAKINWTARSNNTAG
jgi:hypothetical protein